MPEQGGSPSDRIDELVALAEPVHSLSPQQAAKLLEFARLVTDRGVPLGLVARSDRDRILERHVLDSLRAAGAVVPEDRTAYDLGSGAGLPGIVVAVALPHLHITLVESRQRRVAWLELVIEQLDLPHASVRPGRAEELDARVDVCFSRAFAPVDRAWRVARPLLQPGGRLVYFAGLDTPRETLEVSENVRLREDPFDSSGPLAIIAGP